MLGVKTGCNDAYVVRLDSIDGDVASISRAERKGEIEREMLRPLIRGETLGQWALLDRGEYLVWTHCDDGAARRVIPPLTRRWLSPFREMLIKRSDLHGRFPWWSVFRTEGASFARPRVIWADFGLRPRAIVVPEDERFVALNTCYVVSCRRLDDAHALAAILNGPLAAAWLNAIAEPARGGYRRYLGWTMSLLPLPTRWNRARKFLLRWPSWQWQAMYRLTSISSKRRWKRTVSLGRESSHCCRGARTATRDQPSICNRVRGPGPIQDRARDSSRADSGVIGRIDNASPAPALGG